MRTADVVRPTMPPPRVASLRREGIVVFLVAAVLLAPGLTWGIPHATGPQLIRGWDVDGVGGVAVLAELSNLLHAPPRGWYVAYPVFHYLLQGAAYAPYVAYLFLTGGLASPSPAYPFGLADPVGSIWVLHFITRVIAVCMAAGVVALGFAMVRRRAPLGNALVAALAVLVTEPLVFYAHTGNLDVPVLFWSVLTVYLITDPVENLGWRRAAAIGAAAGLAVATKDQAYAVVSPALLWFAFRQWKGTTPPDAAAGAQTSLRRRLTPVAVAAAASLIIFLVAGGAITWPHRFAMHVRYLLNYEVSFANLRHPTFLTVLRPSTFMGLLALAGDLAKALREALGLPLALLGAAAFVASARRSPLVRVLAWSSLGCFVFSIVPIHHLQYRYALFPAFALAVTVGVALPHAANGMSRRLWLAVVAVALVYRGSFTVDLVYQQVRDARYAAGDWAIAHMQPGDEVAYFGGTHQLPHLPQGVQPIWLYGEDTLAVKAVAERQFRWIVVAADYFSADSRDHSSIMPDSVWTSLTSGRNGYRQAAMFATSSLTGYSPYYLPYVNPPVRIFERTAPPTTPRRLSRRGEAPPF
ncbi:MAG: glycosyltransferase family 39 protein [Gemmatimonadaceae bacterium]